jgi:hypothetical protein
MDSRMWYFYNTSYQGFCVLFTTNRTWLDFSH